MVCNYLQLVANHQQLILLSRKTAFCSDVTEPWISEQKEAKMSFEGEIFHRKIEEWGRWWQNSANQKGFYSFQWSHLIQFPLV